MKRRFISVISAVISFIALITATGCSSGRVEWNDKTIDLGLGRIPAFLSASKTTYMNEKGEQVVLDAIDGSFGEYYPTGENSRFEMLYYNANMGMSYAYSEVYYFDGERRRLIDSSGDSVFGNFALCDGERLCYLVSDGTLRVLEKDGGRQDYENAFDKEKITVVMNTSDIKFYAEGNTVNIEQPDYFGSQDGVIINDELPLIRSSVTIEKAVEEKALPKAVFEALRWSGETCPVFEYEGINNIPQYIEQIKKVKIQHETVLLNGKEYLRKADVILEGGDLVLDEVKCFSTGNDEGYAVKAYRFECDKKPSYYEILRFENGKARLLDFSGDSKFGDNFFCDGNYLSYIVETGEEKIVRILDIDGSKTDDSSKSELLNLLSGRKTEK